MKKEHWIKKNESIITSVISFCALLVSMYVILDQKRTANDNLKLMKQQIDLAKAQFDSSNIDRKEQSIKQKQDDSSFQKRILRQDSITLSQLHIASKQLKNQQLYNTVAMSGDEPIFMLDSVRISADTTFWFSVSNKGKRKLKATATTLMVVNTSLNYYSGDTLFFTFNLSPGEDQNLEFTKPSTGVILYDENTIAMLKIKYTDIITKENKIFRIAFNWYGTYTEDKALTLDIFEDEQDINNIERLFKTKSLKL